MNDPTLALEENVIGAMLLDGSQVDAVELAPEDFTSSKHRRIYEAIRRIRGRNELVDVVTVSEILSQEHGNESWLKITAALARDTCTPSQARSYGKLVKQRSRMRQAMRIAADLQNEVTADTSEAIDRAIRELMGLNHSGQSWNCTLAEAMGPAIDEIDRCHQADGKSAGLSTGIRDLDRDMGGMHRSDLIVVGARPAMGKTAFLLNVLLGCKAPAGVISAEQGRLQMALRAIAICGEVRLHGMRTGKIQDDEWSRITAAVNALQRSQVWMFDKPAPTLADIQRQARRWRYEHKIEVLMVDYLQKIAGAGKDKRLEVGDVAIGLKNLGRELDIPVLALAQCNRELEKRPMCEDGMGRMAYMGDLAESGIIEQESDQVMTLYRPEVYSEEVRFKGLAVVNVCKNRHGPVGAIEVSWRGEYLKFGDLAPQEEHWR